MTHIGGLLLDLDGTVYQEGRAIPGAAEALADLRRRGVPLRFTTNTTRRPRATLAERLRSLGIAAETEEILSAPAAAGRWLRDRGVRRAQLLLARDTWVDLPGIEPTEEDPEAVVVGDLGEAWTFSLLNQAFRHLMNGAELLAIQRNRYWHTDGGLSLDAGPFVAALEYGSGKTATLVGKPSPAFFEAAARELGVPREHIAVVGDDLESDVAGARQSGMTGVAVRTGKYRPQDEDRAQAVADVVLDSIASLPSWLEPLTHWPPHPSPPTTTPTGLECRVESRPPLTAGGPVQIQLLLTNPSQRPVWFLNWNTPFEGWRGSVFTVLDPQGTEVPYSGPMMKRGDPGREEYVQIPPGGTVEATADLASVYGLNEPGRYLLRVTGGIADLTAEPSAVPRSREQHQAAPLACGEVELQISP